jgi:hypothetical protein
MPRTAGKSKGMKASGKTPRVPAKKPKKVTGFSVLEKNILLSKGISELQVQNMIVKGICCRDDFKQVGDARTLAQLAGVSTKTAAKVMSWALGALVPREGNVLVESADVVHCVHCGTKQPKDYKSGHLCISCGKQAEPILACFWCASIGPGQFCRQCGAEFVPTGELELAILLKREGLPKQDIPGKLRGMSQPEKDALWGRARRY